MQVLADTTTAHSRPSTLLLIGAQLAMSFFGFNTDLPRDRKEGGFFGQSADPFAGYSGSRGKEDEGEMWV